ncbi:hypothetical protein BJY52DRAFT_1193660 [Lactarius psammicola]|nr:hypothetical protein BJY52DRAFT_1193660 [Lactarius psammicola]
MTNLNLNFRRFLVVSFLLSTNRLRYVRTSSFNPGSRPIPLLSNLSYKVACFCSNPQFWSAARSCIQETCAASGIQDATNFINDLCNVSSEAASTASSSDGPSATSGASQNAAAASLKLDMSLMGGALGILQVVAAMT